MSWPPDVGELLRSPVFEIYALLLGLIAGSFANVCIHRLPRGQSVVTPRSRCPSCGALIGALDNVPLLSYLVLRGRCRRCRAPISPRYPAVEAASGLLYLGVAVRFGPTAQAGVAALLASALLVLTLVDLEHQLLPDAVTLPGVVVGVAASFVPGSGVRPLESFAAAAGGYLAFAALAVGWEKLRGIEALGQGDWKMAAMLGAFLGWQKLLLTVFFATLAGSVVGLTLIAWGGRDFRHRLPLGTFLGLAAVAVLFFGDPTLRWYGSLFDG